MKTIVNDDRHQSAFSEADFAGWEIVCLSHLPWQQTLYQRPHHLMSRLGRMMPVTYVAPLSFRRLRGDILRREGIEIEGSVGGVTYRHVPYTPLSGGFEVALRRTVDRMQRVAREHLAAGERLGRRILLWIQFPPFAAFLPANPWWDALVFDVMDPFRQFRHIFPHSPERVLRAMRSADLIIAGGYAMRDDLGKLAERTLPIPSGVDIEHFRSARDKYPGLSNIRSQGRIAGYAGSLDERIDWDLVYETARAKAEWSFQFAGPGLLSAALRELPNVEALGPIPYERLPQVYKSWTVGLVPFRRSALGLMLSPTKVPEYLAAGLPVLSTELPDVARSWGEYCLISNDAAEWGAMLDGATHQESPDLKERLQRATWERVVETILYNIHMCVI